MAHWMGATERILIGAVLLLAVAGCADEQVPHAALTAPLPPPPRIAPARPAAPVAPPVAVAPASKPRTAGPAVGTLRGRVLIDPGHGGRDSGAEAGGIVEKNLTLEVAMAAAEALRRRGVTVQMTRRSDKAVELESRAAAAQAFKPDLFIAIHADSNPSPAKIGHSILLPESGNPRSSLAAQWVDRDLTAAGSPSHIIREDDRGLYVLRHTTCPAILLEMGFLSNPIEAAWLRDPAYRRKLSLAIANGVTDYLRHK